MIRTHLQRPTLLPRAPLGHVLPLSKPSPSSCSCHTSLPCAAEPVVRWHMPAPIVATHPWPHTRTRSTLSPHCAHPSHPRHAPPTCLPSRCLPSPPSPPLGKPPHPTPLATCTDLVHTVPHLANVAPCCHAPQSLRAEVKHLSLYRRSPRYLHTIPIPPIPHLVAIRPRACVRRSSRPSTSCMCGRRTLRTSRRSCSGKSKPVLQLFSSTVCTTVHIC